MLIKVNDELGGFLQPSFFFPNLSRDLLKMGVEAHLLLKDLHAIGNSTPTPQKGLKNNVIKQ